MVTKDDAACRIRCQRQTGRSADVENRCLMMPADAQKRTKRFCRPVGRFPAGRDGLSPGPDGGSTASAAPAKRRRSSYGVAWLSLLATPPDATALPTYDPAAEEDDGAGAADWYMAALPEQAATTVACHAGGSFFRWAYRPATNRTGKTYAERAAGCSNADAGVEHGSVVITTQLSMLVPAARCDVRLWTVSGCRWRWSHLWMSHDIADA